MRKLSTVILFGFLLFAGAGTESAHSGTDDFPPTATFKLTNKAGFSIMIKFFSQSRNWEWPSSANHWTLSDNGEHDFRLGCQAGEKICYGGSYTADDKTYWGVGFKGNKGCQNCCLTCGENVWHAWDLTGSVVREGFIRGHPRPRV